MADIPDVVAETVKQMESQAMVNRGSTWIMKDEEVTDTKTWLQHRLENISELELEGSPSRILNLNEGTSEILSQAVHSMFAHKIPYLHSSSSNVNLMTPSQARLVQEIIEDVGTILVNEEAHNIAFQSKEFLPSMSILFTSLIPEPVTAETILCYFIKNIIIFYVVVQRYDLESGTSFVGSSSTNPWELRERVKPSSKTRRERRRLGSLSRVHASTSVCFNRSEAP